MRKLPMTAAEDLLEIVMRRYERASTLLTSNRPVEDWGQVAARQCGRHYHARPLASPRTRTQMRSAKLAHKNRLASSTGSRVEQSRPGRLSCMAGFAVTTWPLDSKGAFFTFLASTSKPSSGKFTLRTACYLVFVISVCNNILKGKNETQSAFVRDSWFLYVRICEG